jgi:hypothetical protein
VCPDKRASGALRGYREVMSLPDQSTGESGGVQQFIIAKQADILQRAIVTLRDCPDEKLVAETHRLSGTLGTYQLGEASTAVRSLYDLVRSSGTDGVEDRRTVTLAVLARCLDDVTAASGGALKP